MDLQPLLEQNTWNNDRTQQNECVTVRENDNGMANKTEMVIKEYQTHDQDKGGEAYSCI